MLKVKFMFMLVSIMIAACASVPSLPLNSTIAVIRPYEKIVGNKLILGIYSTACPKSPGGRVICANDVQLPTPEDVNNRFGYTGDFYFSKRFQLIQEMRREDILHKNGAAVALLVGPKEEKQTSFAGFSPEFLGHMMLTAMSVVTKSNAYDTNAGAFISGTSGAFKYTSSSGQAIKTKTNTLQQNGYMVSALRIDAKKNNIVREIIYCPKEVENDKWACLSVVAIALETATSNK